MSSEAFRRLALLSGAQSVLLSPLAQQTVQRALAVDAFYEYARMLGVDRETAHTILESEMHWGSSFEVALVVAWQAVVAHAMTPELRQVVADLSVSTRYSLADLWCAVALLHGLMPAEDIRALLESASATAPVSATLLAQSLVQVWDYEGIRGDD